MRTSIAACIMMAFPMELASSDPIDKKYFNDIIFNENISNTVFAAANKIRYAVRMAGEYELGYYYEIDDSDNVNFHTCPSGEPLLRLHRDDIKETSGVNCKSVPGVPPGPFPSQRIAGVMQWIYDAKKSGYVVSDKTSGGSDFVPCDETPAALIAAARHSEGSQFSLVGGNETELKMAMEALAANDQQLAPGQAAKSDCEQAYSFWTVPIGRHGSDEVVAVTPTQPFAATE